MQCLREHCRRQLQASARRQQGVRGGRTSGWLFPALGLALQQALDNSATVDVSRHGLGLVLTPSLACVCFKHVHIYVFFVYFAYTAYTRDRYAPVCSAHTAVFGSLGGSPRRLPQQTTQTRAASARCISGPQGETWLVSGLGGILI